MIGAVAALAVAANRKNRKHARYQEETATEDATPSEPAGAQDEEEQGEEVDAEDESPNLDDRRLLCDHSDPSGRHRRDELEKQQNQVSSKIQKDAVGAVDCGDGGCPHELLFVLPSNAREERRLYSRLQRGSLVAVPDRVPHSASRIRFHIRRESRDNSVRQEGSERDKGRRKN